MKGTCNNSLSVIEYFVVIRQVVLCDTLKTAAVVFKNVWPCWPWWRNNVPSRAMEIRAYCKQILGSFHCYKAADLQPTTGNGSVPLSCSVLEPPHPSYIMTSVPFPVPVSCAV